MSCNVAEHSRNVVWALIIAMVVAMVVHIGHGTYRQGQSVCSLGSMHANHLLLDRRNALQVFDACLQFFVPAFTVLFDLSPGITPASLDL